eukprot:514629-Pleurochrysis_carterae.AAC.1
MAGGHPAGVPSGYRAGAARAEHIPPAPPRVAATPRRSARPAASAPAEPSVGPDGNQARVER